MGQTVICSKDETCESNGVCGSNNSNNPSVSHDAVCFGSILKRNGADCEETQGCCMGNVFGTYLHGVFDHPQMAQGIIEALCERKGISAEQISAVDFASYKGNTVRSAGKGRAGSP